MGAKLESENKKGGGESLRERGGGRGKGNAIVHGRKRNDKLGERGEERGEKGSAGKEGELCRWRG